MLETRFGTNLKKFCWIIAVLLAAFAVQAQSPDMRSKVKAGDAMPPIQVRTLAGDTFSLASLKGDVVVVNFWATWCGPCMVEMPELEKQIWRRYRDRKDFRMVAISREEEPDVVEAFHRKHPEYTFPLAVDPRRESYKHFADAGIPRTFVIDRKGVLLFEDFAGGADHVQQVSAAVAKALAR